MQPQPTILYVEDEPRSRKVMQMLLKGRMGLPNVTIFEDSTDFLKRAALLDPKPDVVFLDIHVQPYNGFEMLNMLRKLPQLYDTPIVALTASVMNEEIQQLKSSGFNGCLSKPLDLEAFPSMLQQILEGEELWHITS